MTNGAESPSRRKLAAVLGVMAIVLAVAVVATLAAGMRPNDKQWNERPRVQLPMLAPGQFAYVDDPMAIEPWLQDLLFVRALDGRLSTFMVSRVGGRHHVGWSHSWLPEQSCDRFEPDFVAGRFFCYHAGAPSGVVELFWNLQGEGLQPAYGPLVRVQGVVEGDQFVILGYE